MKTALSNLQFSSRPLRLARGILKRRATCRMKCPDQHFSTFTAYAKDVNENEAHNKVSPLFYISNVARVQPACV